MKEQNVFSSTEIYGKEAEEFSASNIYTSNSTEKKKGRKKKALYLKALPHFLSWETVK